jgi:hypothetical protein
MPFRIKYDVTILYHSPTTSYTIFDIKKNLSENDINDGNGKYLQYLKSTKSPREDKFYNNDTGAKSRDIINYTSPKTVTLRLNN